MKTTAATTMQSSDALVQNFDPEQDALANTLIDSAERVNPKKLQDDKKKSATRKTKTSAIPPHAFKELPSGYQLTTSGLFLKKGKDTSEKIAGPIWVDAESESTTGDNTGILVKWLDSQGRLRERAFPRRLLHSQNTDVICEMVDQGLRVIPGKELALKHFLAKSEPKRRLTSVSVTGWTELADGELIYVLPHRIIRKAAVRTVSEVIYQPTTLPKNPNTNKPRGTWEVWRDSVAAMAKNEPLLLFGLCQSWGGALLYFCDVESGGFHIFGDSTRGKTTILMGSASEWGCGEDPAESKKASSWIERWNATDGAAEAIAAGHNDLSLQLDEVSTFKGKDFGSTLYNLAGGRNKSRLERDASRQGNKEWRTSILSTGERSIPDFMKSRNESVNAGQLVRFTDIPIGSSVFVQPGDQSQFAAAYRKACATSYGTAGPLFVEKILSHEHNEITTAFDVALSRLKAKYPTSKDPQVGRVMRKFALCEAAGKLASRWLNTPFVDKDVERAIEYVIELWLPTAKHLSDGERGILAVRDFLLKHSGTRFANLDGTSEHSNFQGIAGYRDSTTFYLTESGMREACGQIPVKAAAKALDAAELLDRQGTDRLFAKKTIGTLGKIKVYQVRISILGAE